MKTPIFPLGIEMDPVQPRGAAGELAMIAIKDLVIDDTFQRAISTGSVRVIKRICAAFDWSKFLPVIVVRDGDKFSVIDGQHRTTAAATIGITEVPCYVLACSMAEAAAAFAAINGNVTPVAPIDLWFAGLAARDPECLALQRVLDASSVTVVRRKDGFRAGETRSINVLKRARVFYGDAILTTILQCIVETGDGNPGLIVGSVVNGIGRCIRTKPELLADPMRLFDVFDSIDLTEMMDRARLENARTGNPIQFVITRLCNEMLASRRQAA